MPHGNFEDPLLISTGDEPSPRPTLGIQILKGLLMICGAFLSAAFILRLHFPTGH